MADETRTILIEVEIDNKDAVKSMKQMDETIEKTGKDTKKTTEETKEYTSSLESLNDQVEFLPAGLQGAVKGGQGFVKVLKLIKVSIAATGIGLLVLALGALFSWFQRSREGGEELNKIMGFLGSAFNVLLDVVGDVGEIQRSLRL